MGCRWVERGVTEQILRDLSDTVDSAEYSRAPIRAGSAVVRRATLVLVLAAWGSGNWGPSRTAEAAGWTQ